MNTRARQNVPTRMKTHLVLVVVAIFAATESVRADETEATCVSAYGATACGYDCQAAYGQVRCARTPEGRCSAAYGEIACWDPAEHGWHGWHRYPRRRWRRWPRAQCVSAYGTTRCGYNCTAAFGQVACAASPEGRCFAAYGEVSCMDPGNARDEGSVHDGCGFPDGRRGAWNLNAEAGDLRASDRLVFPVGASEVGYPTLRRFVRRGR